MLQPESPSLVSLGTLLKDGDYIFTWSSRDFETPTLYNQKTLQEQAEDHRTDDGQQGLEERRLRRVTGL